MKKSLIFFLGFILYFNAYAQNVGIGTTTPVEMLEVAGNIAIPPAKNIRYTAARSKVLSIPPAAFTLSSQSTTGQLSGSSVGDYRTVIGNVNSFTVLLVPLYLPDSAVITSITFYVYDNDAVRELIGNIYRLNFTTNSTQVFGTTPSTTGTPAKTTISTTVTSNNVVDNNEYSYYLRLLTYENPELRILGAKVQYTVYKVD